MAHQKDRDPAEYIDLKDAAAIVSKRWAREVTTRALWNWATSGFSKIGATYGSSQQSPREMRRLPAKRFGRAYVVHPADLDAFVSWIEEV